MNCRHNYNANIRERSIRSANPLSVIKVFKVIFLLLFVVLEVEVQAVDADKRQASDVLNAIPLDSLDLLVRDVRDSHPVKRTNVVDDQSKSPSSTIHDAQKKMNATKVTDPLTDEHRKNCSSKNGTNCDADNTVLSHWMTSISENAGMLYRTMCVLLGVTGIVVIYFVVKAVRLRRRRSKSRKYGIITHQENDGDMEMEPLGDGDDEDDDYTVFEMDGRKK